MSSKAGQILKSRIQAGCVLALAVVALVAAMPVTPLCCIPTSSCCPVGMAAQAAAETVIGSATPDCCQPAVTTEAPPAGDRLVPRPVAPHLAILPATSLIAASLAPVTGEPAARTTEPSPDPPTQPRASRAPPLS